MKTAYRVKLVLETRVIIDPDELEHADISEEIFQNTFEFFADDVFHSQEMLEFWVDPDEPYSEEGDDY